MSQEVGLGTGAGMDRYRVVKHLLREPWKHQWAGVRVGAGLDRYRVVQHLVGYHVRARRSDKGQVQA